MALLAGKLYDPGTAVNAATTAALAMTAFDTTNLRHTFTAPSNGIVIARMLTTVRGAVEPPQVLLGLLESSTVRGRQIPLMSGRPAGVAAHKIGLEAMFPVTGLTPGNSYTFDAAYGVEQVQASSGIKYGGPNDTTTTNADGGFAYEIWEAPNILAATMYDPSTAASHATSSLTAMTALNTTNLRNTFTTAASGAGSTSVLVKIRGGSYSGATGTPGVLFGVLGNLAGGTGTNVLGRAPALAGFQMNGAALATTFKPIHTSFLVTGLTANTSYSFDLAMSVDTVIASSTFKYGGPNDTTVDNAWGGLAFEVWKA